MKYTIFFMLLSTGLGRQIYTTSGAVGFILLWPFVSSCTMTLCYMFNQPQWLLAKNSCGDIHLLPLLLNLPWLLLTWGVFFLQVKFSREPFCHRIGQTDIWISRRPGWDQRQLDFEQVIDLTAEFPRDRVSPLKYRCFANLDGAVLSNCDFSSIDLSLKTLIHCANGHGRASTFAALLLVDRGFCDNVEDALQLIRQSRPLAGPNSAQRKWLFKKERQSE